MGAEDGPPAERLDELISRLEVVERRLSRLEEVLDELQAHPASEQNDTHDGFEGSAPEPGGGSAFLLIGRSILTLSGAFLLRAVTEAELVPPVAGSLLGLGYAIAWLAVARRVGAKPERARDATFHALTGALIAFPLLWETTLVFEVFSPAASTGALGLVAAIGIAVARERRIPAVAGVVGGGALLTSAALGFATQALTPFLTCFLVAGVALHWLGHALRSTLLWALVGALVHTLFLFTVVLVVLQPGKTDVSGLSMPPLLALLGALTLGYFGSAIARTLIDGRDLTGLEVAQLLGTLLVGVGGCVAVSWTHGIFQAAVASVALAFGATFYVVAFARAEPRRAVRAFHTFASAALVLTLTFVPLLLGRDAGAIALTILGATASVLGARLSRTTISLHGAALLLSTAISSGLLARIAGGLTDPDEALQAWGAPTLAIALIGLGVASGIRPRPADYPFRVAARATVSLVLALGVDALLCSLGAAALPEADSRPTLIATLPTAVLAATAVALTFFGAVRWAELRWVAYAVLVVGALKLLTEDLSRGHAATLFVSMALYGGALIRVSRRSQVRSSGPPSGSKPDRPAADADRNSRASDTEELSADPGPAPIASAPTDPEGSR